MAWIESHQDLGRHPKLLRLARLLGVSRVTAIGHMHCLWWWALDYAQDGDLSRYAEEDIAEAGGWESDAANFLSALKESGFLDLDMRIHNWEEYTGRLIVKREQNAERKRLSRARHAPVTQMSDGVTGLPNPTEPNPTVPNHTEPGSAQTVASLPHTQNLGKDEEEDGKTVWPEWYATLFAIPGFKVPLTKAQAWLEGKAVAQAMAEQTAYALKSKWPGPKGKEYKDPWATFQHWVVRAPLQQPSNGYQKAWRPEARTNPEDFKNADDW